MFPWGALIGLAGQAVSGVASAFNNRKIQQSADVDAAQQKAYYEAKASENPLSRSDNQQLLGQYDRKAQQQIENARNESIITGATPEYALGVQKAVADSRANLMGKISAEASDRRDKYNDKAEEMRHQKFLDDQERKANRNSTYANLAANAASAAGSIIDSYSPHQNLGQDVSKIETPTIGVDVSTPPTSIEQAVTKMNTGLAEIKRKNKW